MSSINRNKIRKLILKEFKMMGMADMGHGGMKPMGVIHTVDHGHGDGSSTAFIWNNDEQVIPRSTDCCHFSASLDLKLLFVLRQVFLLLRV